MPQAIQSKRDTAAAWAAANTVLAPGQIGVEVDASAAAKMKVGKADGSPWNALGYVEGASGLSRLPAREPFAYTVPIPGQLVPTNLGGVPSIIDSSFAVARATAAGSVMTVLPRMAFNSASSVANRLSGVSFAAGMSSLIAPAAALAWGFKLRLAVAIGDAANGPFGIGFAPPIGAGAWVPSDMLNCCFLGADAGDTQLSVMHNGASGTCTKVSLNAGAGFPHNTNFADLYEFAVEFRSNGSTRSLTWTATNMTTNLSVSGSVVEGSKMPVAGAVLSEFYLRGTGAGGATATIEFYGKQIGPYA